MTGNGSEGVMPARSRKPRRRGFIAAIVLVSAIGLGWLAWGPSHSADVAAIKGRCARLEEVQNWPALLAASGQWLELDPDSQEALIAGAKAARALRDPPAVADFLSRLRRDNPEQIEWLSMLADLQFGPISNPIEGARTCEEILKLDSKHQRSYRRLVYYHAMMQDYAHLLQTIREATDRGVDEVEFHVYAFLADALKLSNGASQTQRWMQSHPSPSVLIAHVAHVARGLQGGIPATDDQQAAAIRKAQQDGAAEMSHLLSEFPKDLRLLAFQLEGAVEKGNAVPVGETLVTAPAEADDDARFWRSRGWLFLRLGDLDEAEKAFERARELNPLSWRTAYLQGDLSRRQGKMNEAERLSRLANAGRRLERELLAEKDVRTESTELLAELADFANDCDDVETASALRRHFSSHRKPSSMPKEKASQADAGAGSVMSETSRSAVQE